MAPNPWVTHIKDFARKNGLSYGCALSNAKCKETYHKQPKETKKEKAFYKRNPQLIIERMAHGFKY
jgi:hypothetical protein